MCVFLFFCGWGTGQGLAKMDHRMDSFCVEQFRLSWDCSCNFQHGDQPDVGFERKIRAMPCSRKQTPHVMVSGSFVSVSPKQLINFIATLIWVALSVLCPLAHAPGVSSRFGKCTASESSEPWCTFSCSEGSPSSFQGCVEPALLPSKPGGWSSCPGTAGSAAAV